jgi:hypothetical protein
MQQIRHPLAGLTSSDSKELHWHCNNGLKALYQRPSLCAIRCADSAKSWVGVTRRLWFPSPCQLPPA